MANQWDNALKYIKNKLPTGPNQFMTGAQNRYNTVMGSGYSAIPESERKRMFESRKTNLYQDVINPEDEKLAARMAISGQTGSGVGGGQWEDKSLQNKRLLSGVYNDIEDNNLNQTITDRNMAFGMSPALAGMESAQLNPWMQYAGLIGNREQVKAQAAAEKKKAKGDLLGGIIGGVLKFL
jgi:hypothetical protein